MSPPVPTPPPRPFFDLPYDVRATIYEQLEADALPPLSKGTEYYAGFALSGSQAKDKIEHVAVQRYRRFLKDFRKTFEQKTGRAVQVLKPIAPKTFRQMRELTIQLPIDPPGKYSRYIVTTLLLTFCRYVKLRIPSGWYFSTRCYRSTVSFCFEHILTLYLCRRHNHFRCGSEYARRPTSALQLLLRQATSPLPCAQHTPAALPH
jgi:hypothetical protein